MEFCSYTKNESNKLTSIRESKFNSITKLKCFKLKPYAASASRPLWCVFSVLLFGLIKQQKWGNFGIIHFEFWIFSRCWGCRASNIISNANKHIMLINSCFMLYIHTLYSVNSKLLTETSLRLQHEFTKKNYIYINKCKHKQYE